MVLLVVVLVVGVISGWVWLRWSEGERHRRMGQEISSEEGNNMEGRDTEEQLSNRHVVLGTPLRPPFPEGIKLAVFATGCYWGAEKGFWRLPGMLAREREHPAIDRCLD